MAPDNASPARVRLQDLPRAGLLEVDNSIAMVDWQRHHVLCILSLFYEVFSAKRREFIAALDRENLITHYDCSIRDDDAFKEPLRGHHSLERLNVD